MPRIAPGLLGHAVAIRRKTSITDQQGGFIESLETIAPALRCRLTDTRLTPRVDENGLLVADVTRTLYAAPGADLRAGDVVVTTGDSWLVQSAADQPDGVYRKAFLIAEQSA